MFVNFIKDGKTSALFLDKFFKGTYGLPIGLSYIIRNFFIHGCALGEGGEFFNGSHVSEGFGISDKAWEYLEGGLHSDKDQNNSKYPQENLRTITTFTCASELWPWPKDDLRKLLNICHREMDDALGTLLLTACNLLKTLVASLIGEI